MAFGAIAGAAVGLIGSSMAADAAGDAAAAGAAVQQAQLDFQKQQYEDWKEIYGPLQEDLGTYYRNINGKELVGKELEYMQAAGQEANRKIQEQMAQRGIEGSGLNAGLLNQNILNTEVQKSMLRSTADQRAAQMKQGFLALGLGQGQQISNAMGNTSNALSSSLYNSGVAQATIINSATDTLGGIVGYGFDQYNSTPSSFVTPSTYNAADDGYLY